MTINEVKLLSANNINIVSIYQEIKFNALKFDHDRGVSDVERAVSAAELLHQPSETPIYFAAEVALGSLNSSEINTLHQYLQGIKDALSSNTINPNGYIFGVYGPQDTCRKIKNDWYSSVLTFYGKPYGTFFSGWTMKQDNSPSGYAGGLSGLVDFDTARTNSYGGWQYHKYPVLWSNYGNMAMHRKKCLYCNRYSYEAHTPNSTGNRCTVCGYEGTMIFPMSNPPVEQNE